MPIAVTTILSFFTGNLWRTGAIALMVALGFYHFIRVPGLEHTIASRDTTIAQQKAELVQLQGAITQQNAAIDAWKKAADTALANQKAAIAKANQAMATQQKVVTLIEKEPVPTPDKECQATLDLLRKYQTNG